MAEKQEHSSARDFHSSSSKLVCPVSLVSLLICTAALVRVEIINQRVHDVEDLVADARQNQNLIKVFTDAASFKRSKRVDSEGEFKHKIAAEKKDLTQVHTGKTRRSSPKDGSNPDELTMESVRSEIKKTLTSLTSRSLCSPKQQICVQGPPGIQGPKGSRGRRGPRGITGKKGSSGSKGKEGRRGMRGIMGPLGAKGDQGIMGPPGQKGEQGIIGPPGQNGEQGIMGKSGPKGSQGVKGSPGPKGNQGFMGPPGAKGDQGIMGPPGEKGEQVIEGKTGTKGNQGVMGSPGPTGNQGFMGPPGPKGKQGTMGPKGEQGIIGVPGPRGTIGAKGDSGDSFSPPKMMIFPYQQTIALKHNAVFQCAVAGNPKPTITWLGKSSSPLRSQDGRLDLAQVNFDDAGKYTCVGRNLLGITSQTAFLTVKLLGPECITYTSLTSGDRKITYKTISELCDNNLKGWYRFRGAAGTRMTTSCSAKYMCNTAATGWLNGHHPTVADGKVSRQVCFSYNAGCCWQSTNIQVRNCGSYYVYYFNGVPACNNRYCSTD